MEISIKEKAKNIFQKSAPILAALMSASSFAMFLDMGTTNFMLLVFFILLVPMYRNAFKIRDRRVFFTALVCGLFYAAAMCFFNIGWFMSIEEGRMRNILNQAIGFSLFFVSVMMVLLDKAKNIEFNLKEKIPTRKSVLLVFFISMICTLLCWLPYFLWRFPADITTDSIEQINQTVGNYPLSNHHPTAHTLVIKFFFMLGRKIFPDSDTKAIAVYTVFQLLALSSAFSYLTATIYKFRIRKTVMLIVWAYYSLLPYHGVYSSTIWKDVLFSAFMVTFSVTLWRILVSIKNKQKEVPVLEGILLFISGMGVCLFRSNGLYAYVFLFVFIVIFAIKCRKFIFSGIIFAALVISLIIKGPVYASMDVIQPDTIESLSIPAQQIAAVFRNEEDPLTDEQLELLSKVVDVEQISDRYIADISDSIKNLVRETDNQDYIKEHKGEFLKLWAEIGLKYPVDYLKAYRDETYGYWYPDVRYWVYAGEFRSDNMDIEQKSYISEKFGEFLDNFRFAYKKYYVLGLFWSIGGTIWLLLFSFCVAVVKNKKSLLLPYLTVIGIWLTLLIATPVFSEFRYAYSIFSTLPLFFVIPFFNEEKYPVKQEITVTENTENSENTEITENSENTEVTENSENTEITENSENTEITENSDVR